MSIQRFAFEKIASEKLVLPFDFSDGLVTGETIIAPITVNVKVVRGKDINPNAMLNGAITIDATNKFAFVPVQAGVAGVEYLFEVVAPTNNPKKVLAIKAILPVI